jgi:hypothetical protein
MEPAGSERTWVPAIARCRARRATEAASSHSVATNPRNDRNLSSIRIKGGRIELTCVGLVVTGGRGFFGPSPAAPGLTKSLVVLDLRKSE